MHIKKAWHFYVFIGFLEVFDYLILLTTTSKAHAFWRERRCFTLGGLLKLSKFQGIPNKQFRFFLFYDVHNLIMRYCS